MSELELTMDVLKLTISGKMMKELSAKLKDWEGRLSGMAGVLTRTRWTISVFYAVVAAAENDMKQGMEQERAGKRAKDQRLKDGLVAASRFELPRAWLCHLLHKADQLMLRAEAFSTRSAQNGRLSPAPHHRASGPSWDT